MNIFKNIKVFSSLEQTVKALNFMIYVVRGIALLFLIIQAIIIFKGKDNFTLEQ